MLTSAATLNSTSLAALGGISPTNASRMRLQRTQPVSLWSSSPQNLLKPRIISTTTATGGGSSWETETSVKTAVATVDSSGPAEKDMQEKTPGSFKVILQIKVPSYEAVLKQQTSTKYYFVVANAKFMLDEEEHFQEQLFERLRLYGERNKEQDFWLVIEPKFLEKFPKIAGRLKRPAVALVSTNGTWITFMKLRLDRVLLESFEADSLAEALASHPVDLDFEKPEKWVAPYPKYESGWWETFLPPSSAKHNA
ncbi:hypothetical protein RHGRI_002632 [Rhododendron griersonianum]|uniref:Uncharacterized protein n=1 Tax=Rhododendron griersonianum TaxID=479676 RepID=A0AAV6LQ67_9ERIC|nr:hypothetical protein RHGRI_002632 [Rhododendron griersonianum]